MDQYLLSEADAAAVIRLLGDVAGQENDLAAQRVFLMNGLCVLIEASAWAWATACKVEPGEAPSNAGFYFGGFTPEQFAKFQEAIEHPDTAIINAAFTREFAEKKTHLTRRREQIDPENHHLRSSVWPIWQAAGVGQIIMSIRPGERNSQAIMALYRPPGAPPFTPRDSRIAHIVLSEIPWLYELVPSKLGVTVTQLSPRQRITLNLLLEGQDRKQIAEHLGISYHTVDEYAKEVYRYFSVHSQPELIARFRSGDGGDVA
jgi:DNA-binding CsgD family transcriptional regulator